LPVHGLWLFAVLVSFWRLSYLFGALFGPSKDGVLLLST
jgi:hypothetical protein